ncbi:MAG: rhamnulokinase [Treponema sp.]|jgi:rhamnulokinase|nr:rhamnulokinase [Treponema sp.]
MSDTSYHLAIDMGASGGRHILGHSVNGVLEREEVHRFGNAPVKQGDTLVWDIERLFAEIVAGIGKCATLGKVPATIGIDTWGVDYVLLDKQGREIMPAHSYRDGRTIPFINTSVPFEELYAITGTAKNSFNTIYQLLADKAAGRLDTAATLLLLPEYFSQRLTGTMSAESHEYTESSTTGLLDATKRNWAWSLIDRLGLPARLFRPIRMPPYVIGDLSAKIQAAVGFNASVVMVASHDTASAVSVVPDEDALYISSGTWSLLGIQGEPILTEAARQAAYTNEGAANGNIRFLKNIMGLWMIQSVRHELGDQYSFAELELLAKQSALVDRPAIIDVNRACFLSPESMMSAIADECVRVGVRRPETPGDFVHCVYTSLAECYRQAIVDLERITGKTYRSISVIGGGSKDRYLNALTEQYTGKVVRAGPAEATAIGNLMAQIKVGEMGEGV